MEYKIIKTYGCPVTDNLEMELEDEVNNYIAEGWKPIGSICVVNVGVSKNHNENFIEVWQPMILEN